MKAIAMEKAYNPGATEEKWSEIWKENGLFDGVKDSGKPCFSMILPTLRVTNNLHMRHSLTFTIPGVIAGRKKMQGFDTVWLPGPDLEDEEMKAAVSKAFVQLYREGEIYPGTTTTTAGPKIPKQWFLKTSGMARAAIEVVEKGKITFIPEKWKKEYLRWMYDTRENRDRRISRQPGEQPGEGHRIPAYYCSDCDRLMVEEKKPGTCETCGSTSITQDPNVPDTWFSSAMWPFTMKDFYPMSLMAAGPDMKFLGVAGMIMMGIRFGGDIPFREVLINGLIRDEKERKMSHIIDKYGTDALRFTLAVQAVPGMDISLPVNRVKGYKAFANKIWNASRYVLMNLEGDEDDSIDFDKITEVDRWILNGLNNTVEKVNDRMDNYRIYEAAHLLYHFFRHEYCDWYLEFSRNDIRNRDTRKTLKFTLYKLLQLLHPFMPCITEEIFQKFNPGGKHLLQTEFPALSSDLVFSKEFVHVELLKKIVMETRKTRTENGIDPGRRIAIFLKTDSDKEKKMVEKNMKYFDLLAKSAKTEITADFSGLPKGFRGSCPNWEILLPLDSEKERRGELDRLENEMEKIENRIASIESKLNGGDLVDTAPGTAVSDLKKDLQKCIDRRAGIRKTLDDLS